MLMLSYLQLQKYSRQPKIILRKERGLCRGRMASNSISVLRDNRTLVIASYFDNRVEKLTRVIGIVPHEEVKEHYCWFCCQAADKVYISKAVIDVHADHFGFPYATADLICMEPRNCEPRSVSLNSVPYGDGSRLLRFEIKNRKLESSSVEFTVCISTMFGDYNNILQFIQSMEMYKLLGARRVVIYKNSCSPLMEKVLEFYVAEGTVEIVPWPITSYLSVSTEWKWDPKGNGTQIGYYGQIAALNDCVYRNMYRSRYVLLNDVDEIILPVEHADWKALMESLEKQNPEVGIFLFENHVFPNTVFTSVNIPSWNAVPGVNILQHNLREPDRKEVLNPRKMIVNPRKVVQTSVHSVLQALGDSIEVPMEVAMVHHCRAPWQPDLPREFLIRDTTLWRYNSSLISSVSRVLRNIPLQVVK
ncbi:glycosyltransferase family 92 protein F13G3.3-like [Elgaria multicarinata webbii]|uniref:glycosyltransferase family 92 protein F13G3.3-like n=1 Tax=Elgaria multicarinata webbii TaxID=159646 RepID=UPI002FCCFDE5